MTIEKDVLVKISATTSAAGEMTKLAKGAKDSASETARLQKSLDQVGSAGKQIGQAQAEQWRKITESVKGATSVLDQYTRKAKEAGDATKKIGDGGSALGNGLKTVMMAGAVGKIVSEIGAVRTNMLRNEMGGVREKGEGGLFATTADKIRDTWNGRDMKERSADRMREMTLWGQGNRLQQASAIRDVDDQGFRMGQRSTFAYNPFGAIDPNAENKLQMRNLEGDRNRLEARDGGAFLEARRLRAQLPGLDRTANTASDMGEREKARTEAFRIAQKIAELEKSSLKDRQSMLQIDQQRLQLAEQMKRTAMDKIKSEREQFAELDPMQQQLATSVGGKLRRGAKIEDLDPAEREAAEGIGLLRPLLTAAKARKVDENGDFARFKAETGNTAEQAAAQKALQVNGGVQVELFLDEAKLAEAVKAELGPLIRDVKAQIGRQADDLADQKERDFRKDQARAAAAQ